MRRDEQETILRWDRSEPVLHLYTADARTSARWRRLGYPVRVLSPRSWAAEVPLAVLRPLRRLVNGAVVKRQAPRHHPFTKGGGASNATAVQGAGRAHGAS